LADWSQLDIQYKISCPIRGEVADCGQNIPFIGNDLTQKSIFYFSKYYIYFCEWAYGIILNRNLEYDMTLNHENLWKCTQDEAY
jgi:hypothetical protein